MAIRLGLRGPGGEIGDCITRALLAMRRPTYERFKQATGSSIVAYVRGKGDINDVIRNDRSYRKLTDAGDLHTNTLSSYAYVPLVRNVEMVTDVPGRLRVTGTDGRILDIDYVVVPEKNVDVPQFNEIDLMIDATGNGFKDEKIVGWNFGNYALYPNLVALATAPVKKVVKTPVPHQINGLTALFGEPLAVPGRLNATASCSTHGGVDLIRYIREGIIAGLQIGDRDLVIEGGQFDAHHSLTPSDKPEVLPFYRGGYIMQETGFGDAAGIVYPVPGIGNIKAATGRYMSYQQLENGIWLNGISQFSLAMTISVPKGKLGRDLVAAEEKNKDKDKAAELKEIINSSLWAAHLDPEGRKHIGLINPEAFSFKDNKKTGIFSLTSLVGMTPTTMLPLGDNINVVKAQGTQVVDGQEREVYIVTVKNAAYDNRLGFTADMLEETNRITRERLGEELIPGFNHQEDIGDALAFMNTPAGKQMFAAALKKAKGEIVLGHKIAS